MSSPQISSRPRALAVSRTSPVLGNERAMRRDSLINQILAKINTRIIELSSGMWVSKTEENKINGLKVLKEVFIKNPQFTKAHLAQFREANPELEVGGIFGPSETTIILNEIDTLLPVDDSGSFSATGATSIQSVTTIKFESIHPFCNITATQHLFDAFRSFTSRSLLSELKLLEGKNIDLAAISIDGFNALTLAARYKQGYSECFQYILKFYVYQLNVQIENEPTLLDRIISTGDIDSIKILLYHIPLEKLEELKINAKFSRISASVEKAANMITLANSNRSAGSAEIGVLKNIDLVAKGREGTLLEVAFKKKKNGSLNEESFKSILESYLNTLEVKDEHRKTLLDKIILKADYKTFKILLPYMQMRLIQKLKEQLTSIVQLNNNNIYYKFMLLMSSNAITNITIARALEYDGSLSQRFDRFISTSRLSSGISYWTNIQTLQDAQPYLSEWRVGIAGRGEAELEAERVFSSLAPDFVGHGREILDK